MFDKLQEAQKKIDEIKQRLESIYVMAEVENGKIRVQASGARKIYEIYIDPEFKNSADAEELQELITAACNRALEQAEKLAETEMAAAARGMLPGLGNLFGS